MYLLREKILSSISSIKNERCCVIVFPNFHFSHVCYCPKKKTPKKTELKNAAEREMLFSSSSIVSRSNTLLSVSQNSCRPKGKKALKIKQEENLFNTYYSSVTRNAILVGSRISDFHGFSCPEKKITSVARGASETRISKMSLNRNTRRYLLQNGWSLEGARNFAQGVGVENSIWSPLRHAFDSPFYIHVLCTKSTRAFSARVRCAEWYKTFENLMKTSLRSTDLKITF